MAAVFGEPDHSRCESIELPASDRMGIYVRRDDPLAEKKQISPKKDLAGRQLIINRDSGSELVPGISLHPFHICGTYSLLYNVSLMAEDGIGCVVGLEHIINTEGTGLIFIPFVPEYRPPLYLICKKYQTMPAHIAMLINEIRKAA